jgi:hypothetical protein
MADYMTVEIKSVAPLLMSNGDSANPLHKMAIEKKKITAKRKKTEEDHLELLRLDWLSAIYFDEQNRPCLRADNINAMIVDGAKVEKCGKEAKAKVCCVDDTVPIQYNGPKDYQQLWGDDRFVDVRCVRTNNARVPRCRPIFREWSCKFKLFINDVDKASVQQWIKYAGERSGIGDFRPRFGRFEVVKIA